MNSFARNYLKALIVMGLIEGTSTLLLFFVAMPLKYWWETPEAVTIVGSVHGFLFVILVLMFLFGRWAVPISWGFVFIGFIAAIIPFGPFLVDFKIAEMLREGNSEPSTD
jgi:integral membrane protein